MTRHIPLTTYRFHAFTLLLVAAALAVSAAEGPPIERSWFQRRFVKPSWEQALSECSTPRDACRLVRRYISYRAEKSDHWSTANETWERGYGDCEDLAILAQEICSQLGFVSSLQIYYPTAPLSAGHVIVTGKHSGRSWFSSNGFYKEVDSTDNIVGHVAAFLHSRDDRLWIMNLTDRDVQERLRAETSSDDDAVSAPGAARPRGRR